MTQHIHLQPVGGIAGDMFVGALLDALPKLADTLLKDIAAAGLLKHVSLHHERVLVNGLQATQFTVTPKHSPGEPTHHFKAIRARLHASDLADTIKQHAIGILTEIAQAEAIVHGVAIDAVHFHEIADWDSITDRS